MRLTLHFREGVSGPEIANFSHNGQGISVTSGEHGFLALVVQVIMQSFDDARYLQAKLNNAWCELATGADVVWEGSVEKVKVTGAGIEVTAMGLWRELSRTKHTAMWSTDDLSQWRQLETTDLSTAKPEKFQIGAQSGELSIILKKNEEYTTADMGGVAYQTPHNMDEYGQPVQGINIFIIEYEVNLPSDYQVQISIHTTAYSAATVRYSHTGTGAAVKYAILRTELTGREAVSIQVKSTSTVTYSGETGDSYVKVSYARLGTYSGAQIITSIAGGGLAGSGVQTATVVSTTGMYVGQRLVINNGNANASEVVTVTAVDSATQFTAEFDYAHGNGLSVLGFRVPPEVIVQQLVADAAEGGYLESSSLLIEETGLDLTNETFEDVNRASIIEYLASLGDSDGNVIETGVMTGRILYYRPKASSGREWYVDAIDPQIVNDAAVLVNEVYATYQDEHGLTRRSQPISDDFSQTIYGRTAQDVVKTKLPAEVAAILAQTALNDGALPSPQVGISVAALYDVVSNMYFNYEPKPGDRVTIRSFNHSGSEVIDRVATFRVAGHEYQPETDEIMLAPEKPIPYLDVVVAQLSKGISSAVVAANQIK